MSGSPSATGGCAKRREVESTSNFTFYRCCKRQECFFPNAGSYNCGRGQTDRRLLREKAKPLLVKSWCCAVCPSPAAAKDEPRINRGTIGSHRCPRFSLPANGRKPNINRQRNSGAGRARRGKLLCESHAQTLWCKRAPKGRGGFGGTSQPLQGSCPSAVLYFHPKQPC